MNRFFPNRPRVGRYVEIHAGPNAGCCGRIVCFWPALLTWGPRKVFVRMQGGRTFWASEEDVETVD